jgi:hypothetical protein
MKLIKALTFIVGAIALFPSASFAGNLSTNEQVVDLGAIIIGDGNVSSTTVRQDIFNQQKAGRHGDNVSGTRQAVTGHTVTSGHDNIKVKDIYQQSGTIQKSK